VSDVEPTQQPIFHRSANTPRAEETDDAVAPGGGWQIFYLQRVNKQRVQRGEQRRNCRGVAQCHEVQGAKQGKVANPYIVWGLWGGVSSSRAWRVRWVGGDVGHGGCLVGGLYVYKGRVLAEEPPDTR
jgi:hypothetical protein